MVPTKNNPDLDDTNDIHKIIFDFYRKYPPEGVYLVEPYEKIAPNLYFQGRFHGNGLDFFLNGATSPNEINQCLQDVVNSVFWLHKMEIFHGNVKLSNILIANKERPVAYLSDFDCISRLGASFTRVKRVYPYGDICACEGICTPYHDLFGLICLFLQTKLPRITMNLIGLVRDDVFSDVSKGMYRKAIQYWNYYQKDACLNSQQKEIWGLFISICVQSSNLYLRLPRTGEITETQVVENLNNEQLGQVKDYFKDCIPMNKLM